MAIDFAKLAADAAKFGPDLNAATEGGGSDDYTPPAAGACRLRLVAYVEIGKHTNTYAGESKQADKAKLIFELSGPKHPARELSDGTKVPHRITILENAGRNYGQLNEKANLYKLFRVMNYDGAATHFAQLVGKEFLGTVTHEKSGDKVFAKLRAKGEPYSIRPPVFEDPETGEPRRVKVDAPLSDLRLFVWNMADLDQWKSLFIEGKRNPLQADILKADNFIGSPIYEVLVENGISFEAPDAKAEDKAPAKKEEPEADDDLLAGIE